ncbi:hypothetical protein HDC92_004241 [Pedobacter sp. AK017]|nr:hypothetical protein [Pedobacter sp. AK017]
MFNFKIAYSVKAFQRSPLDDSIRYQGQLKIVTPLVQFFLLHYQKKF